jgi:hypothetical protein
MNNQPQVIETLRERLGTDYATIDDVGIMTCPLCDEKAAFRWCLDLAGNQWVECTKCGGQTDQGEIQEANREGIPTLVPIQRKVHLPQVPEWESGPTRIDISAGAPHPGQPDSDWLRDLIEGTFEHADRIEIETWSFTAEDAA